MHKVILADDEAVFKAGVARVLATEDYLRIVAQCGDSPRLNRAIATFRGATVIMASSMLTDVAQMIAEVQSSGSQTILIAENGDAPPLAVVTELRGLVYRNVSCAAFLETIRTVIRGDRSIDAVGVGEKAGQEDLVGARVRDWLTAKEMKIVALIIQGCKNKEIGLRLGTSEQVIKNYLRSIFDKTGVSDRLELALFTIHHRTLADAATSVGNEIMGLSA